MHYLHYTHITHKSHRSPQRFPLSRHPIQSNPSYHNPFSTHRFSTFKPPTNPILPHPTPPMRTSSALTASVSQSQSPLLSHPQSSSFLPPHCFRGTGYPAEENPSYAALVRSVFGTAPSDTMHHIRLTWHVLTSPRLHERTRERAPKCKLERLRSW